MTRQDFIQAANGDERLGTARWLFWKAEFEQYGTSIEWTTHPCWSLECIYGRTNYLAIADAVLAELASVRKEYETKIVSLRCEVQEEATKVRRCKRAIKEAIVALQYAKHDMPEPKPTVVPL